MFDQKFTGPVIVLLCTILLTFSLTGCFASMQTKPPQQAPARNELTLATTTSVNDSGLMARLRPLFERKYNARLKIISVGSGQALEQARRGDADVVFVHDPEAEKKFIRDGYGVKRNVIMSNYFILVGSKNDPAKIRGLAPLEAMKKIANTQGTFISRGDNSGTNKRELTLWQTVGIKPEGNWYLRTGSGQGPTLSLANEKRAYTLSDKATYLNMQKKGRLPNLANLVDTNDVNMLNVYSVIRVNPKRVRGVNSDLAQKFATFMLSNEAQSIIRDFGKKEVGESLFVPANKMSPAQKQ